MMLARLRTPPPSLAVAARAAAADRAARRCETSPARRWMRRTFAFLALLFAGMSFMGGVSSPAQAVPVWDDAKNLPGIILNLCKPANIPEPVSYRGFDNNFGLNTIEDAKDPAGLAQARKTVMPANIQEDDGNGYDRLKKAYPPGGDFDSVIHPTYQRYGFASLRWMSYQYGCMSITNLNTPVSNIIFMIAVNIPSMMIMATLEFALDNPFYNAFTVLISPFAAVFGAIFRPWIVIFAVLVGLPIIWIRSRGSVSKLMGAAAWIALAMTGYLWITQHSSQAVATVNNFIIDLTAQAGCQLVNAGVGGTGAHCTDAAGLDDLHNSIWRGIPYSAWQLGQVGEDQAYRDREAEGNDQIGWSQALLNGVYVGTDEEGNHDELGQKVATGAEQWNNATYGSYGGNTKPHYWTQQDLWNKVPMLMNIKFLCNDGEPANGAGDGNPDDENNRWIRENCDAAGAGTATWIGYFRGEQYDHRLIAAFLGGLAAISGLLVIGTPAAYLAYLKYLLAFKLLMAVFTVAIGVNPAMREVMFATIESIVATALKQVGVVLVLLFVVYAQVTLMFPPPDSNVPEIPWALKPIASIIFFWMMIMFFYPMSAMLKGAMRGDMRPIRKALNAPSEYGVKTAKFTGKAAVVLGAAALTGGTSLGAAALAGGKGAALAKGAAGLGKMVGGGGTGKLVAKGIKLADFLKNRGTLLAEANGMKRAREAGAKAQIAANPGKYNTDPNNPSKAAMRLALKDFDGVMRRGRNVEAEKAAHNKLMGDQFNAHLAATGQYHPLDKRSPLNQSGGQERADLFARAKDRAAADASAPRWARPDDLQARVEKAPHQILAGAGFTTPSQAAADLPRLLEQYHANPGLMDPRHPASQELMRLMHTPTKNELEYGQALHNAEVAVARHGVPAMIAGIGSAGETASRFDPIPVLGVMRPLETTGDPAAHWQARLEQSNAFTDASAFIPVGHPAHSMANAYREALVNPAVPADVVNNLREEVVNRLNQSAPPPPFDMPAGPSGGPSGPSGPPSFDPAPYSPPPSNPPPNMPSSWSPDQPQPSTWSPDQPQPSTWSPPPNVPSSWSPDQPPPSTWSAPEQPEPYLPERRDPSSWSPPSDPVPWSPPPPPSQRPSDVPAYYDDGGYDHQDRPRYERSADYDDHVIPYDGDNAPPPSVYRRGGDSGGSRRGPTDYKRDVEETMEEMRRAQRDMEDTVREMEDRARDMENTARDMEDRVRDVQVARDDADRAMSDATAGADRAVSETRETREDREDREDRQSDDEEFEGERPNNFPEPRDSGFFPGGGSR